MTTYRQGVIAKTRLRPDPKNVRDDLGDLSELTASIRAQGILQPILVRPDGDTFFIVDGHRRYAAGTEAGVVDFPCILTPRSADHATATMLAAAMHKRLEPMEQAKAFRALRDKGMGTSDIAKATGYSAATVRDRLTLLALPSEAQTMVTDRTLNLGQATAMARQVARNGHGNGRVGAPRGTVYFASSHPLADTARGICAHDGTRRIVGGIACGPCWEATIRADALGQTLSPDIDEQAIETAMSGHPSRALTLAELDEAVARLTHRGMSSADIAQRLRVTSRTVIRARSRRRTAA